MDAQIKKGILEMCMLQLIETESRYGYDVIQTLRSFFPEVTESTFYAILRRLNREGAADVLESAVSKGPVRKYYRITGQGRKRLAQMKADWTRLQAAAGALGI